MTTNITEFYDAKMWNTLTVMAKAFHQSGALPKELDNPAKVLMVLQAGREIGLKPIEALNSFYFVNGKLTLYGQRQIAQVIRAGYAIEWGICDDTTSTVKIQRKDRGKHIVTFSMEQAKKSGLTTSKYGIKEVWQKHPKNMLMFKAFGECARFFCPEALDGYYSTEEMTAEIEEENTQVPIPAPTFIIPLETTEMPLEEATAPKTTSTPSQSDKRVIQYEETLNKVLDMEVPGVILAKLKFLNRKIDKDVYLDEANKHNLAALIDDQIKAIEGIEQPEEDTKDIVESIFGEKPTQK